MVLTYLVALYAFTEKFSVPFAGTDEFKITSSFMTGIVGVMQFILLGIALTGKGYCPP